MRLSELFLNRFLYKDTSQDMETKSSEFLAADSTPDTPVPLASGGAAQDINTSNVLINGAQLEPGTYPTTVLDVSNWGWTQTCVFTSDSADTVVWDGGDFISADGTTYTISAGTTGAMTQKTYIYLSLLDPVNPTTTYKHSITPSDAVGLGKVLIAVAEDAAVSATFNLNEATQIVGDNILANTIDASKITAGQLVVGTNVGIGTAEDSAGVTTIIGDTVDTGYINALSITVLGAVTAGSLTGLTITGGTIQTDDGTGHRVVITGANDDIRFYNSSNTNTILLDGSSTDSTQSQVRIGGGIALTGSTDATYSYGTEIWSGGFGGTGIATFIDAIGNGQSASLSVRSSGELWLYSTGGAVNFSVDNDGNINTPSINLNGTTRTSWPSASYPSAGIALSTGSGWGSSITNNSSNWNTAYGWGNHASAGYAVKGSSNTFTSTNTFSGLITANGGITLGASDVLLFSSGAYIDDPKAIYMSSETSAPGGAAGGIYYNSLTGYFYGHDGSSWKQLAFV